MVNSFGFVANSLVLWPTLWFCVHVVINPLPLSLNFPPLSVCPKPLSVCPKLLSVCSKPLSSPMCIWWHCRGIPTAQRRKISANEQFNVPSNPLRCYIACATALLKSRQFRQHAARHKKVEQALGLACATFLSRWLAYSPAAVRSVSSCAKESLRFCTARQKSRQKWGF